jgi:hypothetical protein
MEIKSSTASLRVYARQQLSTSLKGTINGALNWSAILGAGLIGSFLSATGRSPMIFDDTLWGTVETGLACTAVTWLALFAFRFIFVVPYTQWKAGLLSVENAERRLAAHLGPQRDKGFLDALFYALYERWPVEGESVFGDEFRTDVILSTDQGKKAKAALKLLRQKASEGIIKVWGYENPREISLQTLIGGGDVEHKILHEIPKEQWKTYWIEFDCITVSSPSLVWTQKPDAIYFDAGSFAALMVSKEQIEWLFTKGAVDEQQADASLLK